MRILLQTTLPANTPNKLTDNRADDWTIENFSLLQAYLSNLTTDGKQLVSPQYSGVKSYW